MLKWQQRQRRKRGLALQSIDTYLKNNFLYASK
jgi:hypothetical protein